MRLLALFCFLLAAWIAWTSWGPLLPLPPGLPAPPGVPVPPGMPVPGPPQRPPVPRVPVPRLPDMRLPDIRAPQSSGPPIASPVQRILIEKSARRMTIWQKSGEPRLMRIALGSQPVGTKTRQGDGKTPEGLFHIDRRNARSAYHLSLGLDYPQPRDRARARAEGVSPGGDIMIHGQPNQIPEGFRVPGDWTAGCIAVSNPEIAELFAHTAIGTPVEIRP